MKVFFVCVIASTLAGALGATAITNGSFEIPGLTAGTFQYDPSGATWAFIGNAGIASNGSAFGFLAAPAGVQEAFLQTGTVSNSFSETITGVAAGDMVRFSWAQRPGFVANPVTVTYNGVTIFSGSPGSTTWTTVTSSPIASGQPTSGLLVFSGSSTVGVDLDTGIDNVVGVSSSVPEPCSMLLIESGLLAVPFIKRKKFNRE
jgi:hypothetical protein